MEVFKDVVGYEGLYQVSNEGKIKSLLEYNGVKERLLSLAKDNGGYPVVCIHKNGVQKTYKVHRLVALAFIPNPQNKRAVNHIDGVKDNNKLGNLEWATDQENTQHAYNAGLAVAVKGEKHYASRLTERDVFQIRDLAKSKRFTQKEIGSFYNCCFQNISSIIKKKIWAHV